MSKFVNYKKRGVALPPGCKDLIDVLKPSPSSYQTILATLGGFNSRKIVRHETVVGTLSDIPKYVVMMFQPRKSSFWLQISPTEASISLDVAWVKGAYTIACVVFPFEAEPGRTVVQLLERHGLQRPHDAWNPIYVSACSQPGQVICPISPLPSEAPKLSALVTDFFREVWRVKEDAELRFQWNEI